MTDLFDLDGQVAIVTGGARGIGEAASIALAHAGAHVVPVSRSESALNNVVTNIRDIGRDSFVQPTDVTDEDQIQSCIERVTEEFGGLDIVVNNAGINPDRALGNPEDMVADHSDEVWEVNLRGAMLMSKHAGRAMLAGGGSVINIASVGGLVGLPRQHPYVASKHGLVGVTKSMALDWAPKIRVNAVAPGYVRTDLTEGLQSDEYLRSMVKERTPLARFGEPKEIAGAVVFLASDAASFITGTVLTVDGGWTSR